MALVSQANSTSQFFAGTTYYGRDWSDPPPIGFGEQQVVPFLLGPNGVANAIRQHKGDDDPTGVTSSGWGAGQTGTALGSMSDEDLENVELVILDNNTNRAGGGFWTTYDIFAPLLLTSAEPTPNDLPVDVWDVGYEYNINGNAVTYPANVISLANSLAAYVYGYGGEQTAKLPEDTELVPGTHYVVDAKTGRVIDRYDLNDAEYGPRENPVTTTYVTFRSGTWDDNGTPTDETDDEFVPDGPPLLRPLQLHSWRRHHRRHARACRDGNRQRRLQGQPADTGGSDSATADGPGDHGNDDHAEQAAGRNPARTGRRRGDSSRRLRQSRQLRDQAARRGGKLPFVSSLPTSLTNSTVNTASSKKVMPGLNKPTGTTSSTGSERPRPLKRLADNLKKLAGGEHEQHTEESEND